MHYFSCDSTVAADAEGDVFAGDNKLSDFDHSNAIFCCILSLRLSVHLSVRHTRWLCQTLMLLTTYSWDLRE